MTYKNPGQLYEMLQIIPQEIFISPFFFIQLKNTTYIYIEDKDMQIVLLDCHFNLICLITLCNLLIFYVLC